MQPTRNLYLTTLSSINDLVGAKLICVEMLLYLKGNDDHQRVKKLRPAETTELR